MKILISDKLDDAALDLLNDRGFDLDLQIKVDGETLAKASQNADGWIIRSGTTITGKMLENAKALKVIGRAGVGIDNIDVDSATRRGIAVINTPTANTMAAVEHSMALLLSLARHIPAAHQSLVIDGNWDRAKFTGVELYGKTIGVLGLGKIGGRVAMRCTAMEMTVLGYDPFLSVEQAKSMNVELVSDLDGLLEQCDFLSLHLPSTGDTKKLINAERLGRCKPGVRIINCARGDLVDENALAQALRNGHVAGAALDVFDNEPPTGSPLLSAPNLVATPHLGASTVESQLNVGLQIAERVADALQTGAFREAVNIPVKDWRTFGRIKPTLDLVERLGCLAQQYTRGGISDVQVEYCGDAYDEIPAINSTLLKGMLQPVVSMSVNAVNAPVLAQERGISLSCTESGRPGNYRSLVKLETRGENRTHTFSGTTFADAVPRLVEIEGFQVDLFLVGVLLVFSTLDLPGVMGSVGSMLGRYDINVEHFSVGRQQPRGSSLGLVAVDEALSDEIILLIADLPNIQWVRQIILD